MSDRPEPGSDELDLAINVSSDEYIERAIARGHVSAGGQIKWQALKLSSNEEGVSVIRLLIGSDNVKNTAKDVKTRYCGLAEAKVERLRSAGLEVVDRRRAGEYTGHAEIEFKTWPAPLEPYEPELASEGNLEQVNYYKSHVPLFSYFSDPNPAGEGWAGSPLGES